MKISLRGGADKRPIVYPLLYILNQLGGALLVTEDGAYRRLLQSGGVRTGSVGNVRIYSHGHIDREELERYECNPEHFRYMVSDRLETVMKDSDRVITVQRDGDIEPVDESSKYYIRVGFNAPKDKNLSFVKLDISIYKWLYHIESVHRLDLPRDKGFLKPLTGLFADMLDLSPKAIEKLYKGGGLT